MKEHQKIRDFFSKEQEEREEQSFKKVEKKKDKKLGSLPIVNKNLR